jgi:predicted dehydrogenase
LRGNASKRWRRSYSFALIGCGRAGHCYATVLAGHPEMKLAAVIDKNSEASRAFSNSFNCSAYASVDEFLDSGSLTDCAIICTPPSEHTDTTSKLLKNRINVLCESPFGLSSDEARKMFDIARAFGLTLMRGSKFRFVADIIHAKGLIQAGILGHILEFEGDFREIVDMSSRWNVQPEISGGGVLIESGSLVIDVVRYLFGTIQAIRAEEGRRVQSKDVEDTVRLELSTDTGILGTLHLSWSLKNSGDDYFRIYGTQGNMCIGWKRSIYRPNGAADWINFGEGYSTQKSVKLQMSHFLDVVSGEDAPEITAEESIEAVRVIEYGYQSLASGRHLSIYPAASDQALAEERKLSIINAPKASFPTWIFRH